MTPHQGDPTDVAPRAAALQYEPGADRAPRVVAKGQGPVAQEIIRRARENGVAVHESRELVAALMQFELDQQIPPALYIAVAEVLAWAYGLESDAAANGGPHADEAIRCDPANSP